MTTARLVSTVATDSKELSKIKPSDSKLDYKPAASIPIEKLSATLSKGASSYLATYGQTTDDSYRAKLIQVLNAVYQVSDKKNEYDQDFLNETILYTYLAIKNIKDSLFLFDIETSLFTAIRSAASASSFELPDDPVIIQQLKQSVFFKGMTDKSKEKMISAQLDVIKNEMLSERPPHLLAHPEIIQAMEPSYGSHAINEAIDANARGKRNSERLLLDIFAAVLYQRFMLVDKTGNLQQLKALYHHLTYYYEVDGALNANPQESGYSQSTNPFLIRLGLVHGMKKLIEILKPLKSFKLANMITLYDALVAVKPDAEIDTLLFLCEAIKQGHLGSDYFADFRVAIRETVGLMSNNNYKIESAFYYILGDMIPYSVPMANQVSGFSFSLMSKQTFNMSSVIHQNSSPEQELRLRALLSAMKFSMIRCSPHHAERTEQIKSLLEYMKHYRLDQSYNATQDDKKDNTKIVSWKPGLYQPSAQSSSSINVVAVDKSQDQKKTPDHKL